ncbi:MAG TPA: hypothetical protein VFK56_06855 [Mycobacterium sp.]|nr:hypothetical protein [Mycobacterium sp.]
MKNSPESRQERMLGALLGLALAGREDGGPVDVVAEASWPDAGPLPRVACLAKKRFALASLRV